MGVGYLLCGDISHRSEEFVNGGVLQYESLDTRLHEFQYLLFGLSGTEFGNARSHKGRFRLR